jgi:tRNA-specific 2-thiouridylase
MVGEPTCICRVRVSTPEPAEALLGFRFTGTIPPGVEQRLIPMVRPSEKILLAMSGGVDSSVAAALLVEAGHEVVGVFMRLGSPGEGLDELIPGSECNLKIGKQGCCSVGDAQDARTVAAVLDIPFYVVNFKKEFGRIIDHFVEEYDAGRTPNPCVRCNDWLKFGRLHEYAKQIGAHRVASGHYASIGEGPTLLRGLDLGKDQSYVLFGTPRDRLGEMLLPIGDMHKKDVRALAEARSLPVFDKPDSQEICFVPDNDYAGLVSRRSKSGVAKGEIHDLDGNAIGEHPGHQHFTIGQRRKVGVALGHPIYVIEKNHETNTVVVGPREALAATGCLATDTNWLIDPPEGWLACTAKIRYNAEPVAARVRVKGAGTLEVGFDSPQEAVAPGQAVVCYHDRQVIGGGWISSALSLGAKTNSVTR